MGEIVGVHGIGQQQGGRNQLLGRWDPALRDGIERVIGRSDRQFSFDLAYYGDIFLAPGGSKGDLASEFTGASNEEIAFLADAVAEVVGNTQEDSEVLSALGKGPFRRFPLSLQWAARQLDERFGAAGALLFFQDMRQVKRYLDDDTVADGARERVLEAVGEECRVLVGHSLGSVVAYETLCLHQDLPVGALVTLGSPLSLATVRTRLRTIDGDRPQALPSTRTWVNVYDPRDPVACAGGLMLTWTDVTDRVVDNGSQAHAVERYLGKKATGEAVLAALGSRS